MELAMKFETKLLTLAQRVECNKNKGTIDKEGNIIVDLGIDAYIKYCRYGLKSLNGIEITDENFESEIMKLTNDEIREIGDKIADETNFPKKK